MVRVTRALSSATRTLDPLRSNRGKSGDVLINWSRTGA